MRFSMAAVASMSIVSVALALPYAPPTDLGFELSTRSVVVSSDTGSVNVDFAKRQVTHTTATDSAEQDEEHDISIEDFSPAVALEARVAKPPSTSLTNANTAIAIANGIITIGTSVDKFVKGLLKGDIERRQQFTQRTVSDLRRQFPYVNFVMSNVGYRFDGAVSVKRQVFYHNRIGAKVSFDIIGFQQGTFQLQGDGGFENWAYQVDSRCTRKSKFVQC